MLYINTMNNQEHHCAFYFGLEEYLLKDYPSIDEDIFLLWNVEPTVMIGRHQVTEMELDQDYIDEHGIHVVRRRSGGGAVYTDKGCLQFSFITKKRHPKDIFKKHVKYIVDAVNKLGLHATFTGRNDIVHDKKKFSGNAEYIYKDRMVIHGTILFESNLKHLIGSLTPDKSKLTKHAIQSVESRVLNIGNLVDIPLDEFYHNVVESIKTNEISYDILDLDKINTYKQKYYTDDWNYTKSPKYTKTITKKVEAGLFQIKLEIKNKRVKRMSIHGDYFSLKKMDEFENAFIGQPYTYEAFLNVLKVYRIKTYIYNVSTKQFLEFFFERKKRRKMRKPDHLKLDLKRLNKQTKEIKALLQQHNLHTVCQEASCPNQLECFSNKTATFMILGTTCTRNCAFCDVTHGKTDKVDPEEPANIVLAAKLMDLEHVVITSVTRDDLKDYGSKQFVACIQALQENRPNKTIEVLIPDFMGDKNAIKRVVDAKPDVINHNLETVERLYPGFRDNASYSRSLHVLKTVKELDDSILTKSGIMVGIGEQKKEVYQLMDDLRDVGCDILTIGQYLQPSKKHAEVVEYVSLETFEGYKKVGLEKGFKFIASGPLVRSSYEAIKQFKGE